MTFFNVAGQHTLIAGFNSGDKVSIMTTGAGADCIQCIRFFFFNVVRIWTRFALVAKVGFSVAAGVNFQPAFAAVENVADFDLTIRVGEQTARAEFKQGAVSIFEN